MNAVVAAFAAATVSSVNIDGELSTSIMMSSGVDRPLQGAPTGVAQTTLGTLACRVGPLMVAVTVAVSEPRLGPS